MVNIGKCLFGSVAACILLASVYGCGGGGATGSGETVTYPSRVLSWNPPTTYNDSAPLDPSQDLKSYEIYVNDTGTFSDSSSPMAEVGAVNSGTGQATTSFDLATLGPRLIQGVTYHVSIRTVAISGLKSDFSGTAIFSF